MVLEMTVLFGIQDFEKCRSRISLVVAADLIDLVQHDQRVLDARLFHAARDTTRQSSYIRAAMSADLCFVTHAAERHADILFAERFGNRSAYGSLTCSGRSYEAEDRAFSLPCQLPDGKKFQNAFLNFLKSVMVAFQEASRYSLL